MSNYNRALSEVFHIFTNLDDDVKTKLPQYVKNFIKTNRDYDYIPKINRQISLKDQKLMPQTRSLMAMFYVLYFCESKEEQKEILTKLNKNSKINNL